MFTVAGTTIERCIGHGGFLHRANGSGRGVIVGFERSTTGRLAIEFGGAGLPFTWCLCHFFFGEVPSFELFTVAGTAIKGCRRDGGLSGGTNHARGCGVKRHVCTAGRGTRIEFSGGRHPLLWGSVFFGLGQFPHSIRFVGGGPAVKHGLNALVRGDMNGVSFRVKDHGPAMEKQRELHQCRGVLPPTNVLQGRHFVPRTQRTDEFVVVAHAHNSPFDPAVGSFGHLLQRVVVFLKHSFQSIEHVDWSHFLVGFVDRVERAKRCRGDVDGDGTAAELLGVSGGHVWEWGVWWGRSLGVADLGKVVWKWAVGTC